MADKDCGSKSDADEARAAAAAQCCDQRRMLKRIWNVLSEQMGKQGEENSQVKAALLALEQAQLNLERTVIKAPTQGGVSNFSLSKVSMLPQVRQSWRLCRRKTSGVEAYYRENSLGNVTVGDEVEVALDFARAKLLRAVWAVSIGGSTLGAKTSGR